MGKSRSTTIILAHLMAHDPTLTPTTALARLREARPLCEPNPGFMQQLDLYHQTHCAAALDAHPVYQRWLLARAVAASVACGTAPDEIRFGNEQEGARGEGGDGGELRCRRCRRVLAAARHLVPHTPRLSPSSSVSVSASASAITPGQSHIQPPTQPPCAHLYIDPLSWMRPELERGKLDGRLECPKCGTNVGKYAWQGMRCSCGDWVVPAVCLARGRVDEVKSRPAGMGRGVGSLGTEMETETGGGRKAGSL